MKNKEQLEIINKLIIDWKMGQPIKNLKDLNSRLDNNGLLHSTKYNMNLSVAILDNEIILIEKNITEIDTIFEKED